MIENAISNLHNARECTASSGGSITKVDALRSRRVRCSPAIEKEILPIESKMWLTRPNEMIRMAHISPSLINECGLNSCS